MNSTASPDQMASFAVMLRTALGDNLAAAADSFVEMMAEDGVMEFPYITAGEPVRLNGREAIRQHLASLSGLIDIDAFHDLVVHPSQTPGVFILQMRCTGKAVTTGLPYNQRYISVITVADGYIVNYLDYWNPLVLAEALGQAVPVLDAPSVQS
ncbi:nuclear transport factor 2 family protein [Devosia sp.]|uniref:nuclear transport factor 2 family protein n=1 Tax=Devosia sp. TaxID=1871048 RepID=UPI0025B7AA4D|nr:nuclear transport factor 2 family protein [Devosia sp.]